MRCPVCTTRNKPEWLGPTEEVKTGTGKADYLIACIHCSWQVHVQHLANWLKKWRLSKSF